MIDYRLIERQNPWWSNSHWFDSDLKIQEVIKSDYQFIPDKIYNLSEEKKAIHIITGPRQTGKSTSLKLKIKQLLIKKITPQAIFYYNCDALSSKKDIIDLVLNYIELNKFDKYYIFLDEISSVVNWPYAVKWLTDEGFLKNCILYLTGSSSINLKKSGEYLPGRRGSGLNIDFFPLSFYQVLEIKKYHLKKIDFKDVDLIKKLQKIDLLNLSSINKEFTSFLSTGGFLPIINNPENPLIHQIYQETLKSEIIKNGKNEKNMRMVIKKLINSLSAETSYTNIAEEAELGSKNTVIDYLDFLVNSYFLHELLFFDINQKKYILKKNKKFHFTDPYIIWLLWGYFTGNGVDLKVFNRKVIGNLDLFIFGTDISKVIENFIASELVKANKKFYFYKNSRELDFYVPKNELGIEVKYKNNITQEDIKSVMKAKNKIIISKKTLEKRDDILIIPAHLFSLLELG